METIIYVKLLNEGTEAYRPVSVINIKDNIYKILESNNYDKDDEEWEFIPGDSVVCEYKKTSDGELLVATSKY